MKKSIVLLFAVTGLATAAYSQSTESATLGNTTFGIRAGVNFQNLNGKDADGDNLENKVLVGFNIGANVEFPIAQEFYLQPGVLFSTKGAKAEENSDVKVKLSYLEIPINLVYKPVLGDGNLLLGFGPYLGFALGGKLTDGDNDVDIEFEKEISQTQAISGTPYFKRFDAGANLLVGYELSSRISAQLNAQLGLVNINPEITDMDDDDSRTKNTGFGISIGYRF
jgi:hypothetical protein